MGNSVKKAGGIEDIEKFYEFGDKLGSGSFAVVKKAVRKSDRREFAVKIIKKSKLNQAELKVVHDEVEIMHKVNHPHCVQLFEMFETPKKIFFVLELLTGKELFDRIIKKGSYSEREASATMRSVADALQYLHSIGITHRDLKPENLIYLTPEDNSPVKITDFGLAKYRAGKVQDMRTACGTPGYVAPEILKGEPYGSAVDMWSLGVILYILLCGFPPFFNDNTAELYKQIKRGQFDFPAPYWTDVTYPAKDLVRGLLTVDPVKRLTAKQVIAHPWISGEKASTRQFGQKHTMRLKVLQARRKLKKGIQLIMAVNKFSIMFGEECTPPTPASPPRH